MYFSFRPLRPDWPPLPFPTQTLQWTSPGPYCGCSQHWSPQPGTWLQCSESLRNTARDFSNAGLLYQANACPRFKAGEERNSVARIAIWDTRAARLALCAFLPRVPGLELRLAVFSRQQLCVSPSLRDSLCSFLIASVLLPPLACSSALLTLALLTCRGNANLRLRLEAPAVCPKLH